MNAITAMTVGLAAASSLLSAISALAAWRSMSAFRDELKHTITASCYALSSRITPSSTTRSGGTWARGPTPNTLIHNSGVRSRTCCR
ncbi:hypothetical protein [Actinoplanes sp. DH11]|uniref:hypothetical protein n=1 Tax=Actinoplanes sp. DH11 TaxID=2857011 RepID=UPI001E2D0A25|nr:hypothetical protein [Actinoplanes sp. DH11]